MNLYEKWFKHVPKNPMEDLRVSHERHAWQRFLSSVDEHGVREFWSTLTVVCSWAVSRDLKEEIIKELAISGAHLDAYGTCGLTAAHYLILKIVLGSTPDEDLAILLFLIRLGVHVTGVVFLNPDWGLGSRYGLSVREFIQHVRQTPSLPWSKIIPPYDASSIGANTVNESAADVVHAMVSILDGHDDERMVAPSSSATEFFWESMICRWKLPFPLPPDEIRRRIHFLQRHQSRIDASWIASAREERYYHHYDEAHVFVNPSFMDKNELMPFEHVRYTDDGGFTFHFHKTMVVPFLFRKGVNPCTGMRIPKAQLAQWVHEMLSGPVVHCLCSLADTLYNRPVQPEPLDLLRESFFFIHSLIVHSHPYTNFFDVKDFTPAQIQHLCASLSRHPFRFMKFRTIRRKLDSHEQKVRFVRICMEYLMKRKHSPVHRLHFAVEECLHDFQMVEEIRGLCDSQHVPFHANNLWLVCNTVVEVNDMLLNRVGFFDARIFTNLWHRLCSYHQHEDKWTTK